MALPKIDKKDIYEAVKFIDENGIPAKNQSTRYKMITKDGKEYPPKYVLAIADHIANKNQISTEKFQAREAKLFLQKLGFNVEIIQKKYELTITAEEVTSTDELFTMDNLAQGDYYQPLEAYCVKADGRQVRRNYVKGERRICNQTLPRIACQVFEKSIASLSKEEKETFPICRYTKAGEVIRGIYANEEEYKKHRNTLECMRYYTEEGIRFVTYGWNIFSTIIFVQECLKRFGEEGDRFVLVYREKEENSQSANESQEEMLEQQNNGYRNKYSKLLLQSKNMIFRGAPGTGKTYLAKEIAADIISNGYFEDYTQLSEEQKKQIEFVQFHPSYDYSDFVEGLRPKMNEDGSLGFELQDGVFKKFVAKARQNYENSRKSKEIVEQEISAKDSMIDFFSNIEYGGDVFETVSGNKFYITDVDEKYIHVYIPENDTVKQLRLNLEEVQKMLESKEKFEKVRDVTEFFRKQFATQAYSYDFAIYKAICKRKNKNKTLTIEREELKKYIFIIDEINRGEISKIFGELFFSIDPGYRGEAGEIATQYANMHSESERKFYIPPNVYIIGTMNDIDRSVDSFDFAMRRRFRFVEIKPEERLEMLEQLENEDVKIEAIRRMGALNEQIRQVEELNENYQIGASYFLRLKNMDFDELWTDCLQPLLQDYIQGMYDEKGKMERFAKAYGYKISEDEGNINENSYNEG